MPTRNLRIHSGKSVLLVWRLVVKAEFRKLAHLNDLVQKHAVLNSPRPQPSTEVLVETETTASTNIACDLEISWLLAEAAILELESGTEMLNQRFLSMLLLLIQHIALHLLLFDLRIADLALLDQL